LRSGHHFDASPALRDLCLTPLPALAKGDLFQAACRLGLEGLAVASSTNSEIVTPRV